MKHNSIEILKAIEVIRDECEFSSKCPECSFYIKCRCGIIQGEPHTWKLNDDVWKVFKK